MTAAFIMVLMFMSVILFIHILFMRPLWKGSLIGTGIMLALNVVIYHKSYWEGDSSGAIIAGVIGIVMSIIGMVLGSVFQGFLIRQRTPDNSTPPK